MSLNVRNALVVSVMVCASGVVNAGAGGPGFDGWNLAVVRVGDGSAALTSAAFATFIEERSPATGSLVGPVLPLPTTVSGSNRRLVSAGTATLDEYLTQSQNLNYLLMGGYDAAVGTAGVSASNGNTINRVIARIRISDGAIDTTTATPDLFSGGNIRSVCSDTGNRFWAAGNNGSVRYVSALGGTTSIQLSNSPTNVRVADIYNLQLYVSSGSGAFLGVNTVGGGLPVTNNQTTTLLSGFPTSGTHSPVDYFFASDTRLYVADDGTVANGGGIQKWIRNDAGVWSLSATYSSGPLAAGCKGITGYVDQAFGQVVLFVTTAQTSNNSVVRVEDVLFNDLNSTVLASAGTNMVYRGVRLVKGSCFAPTIFTQPQDQYANIGEVATFHVVPSVIQGTPVRYYWRHNGTLVPQTSGVSGVNTDTLVINPVDFGDPGTYDCVIGTPCGSVTSNAAQLISCEAPAIVQQPTTQAVVAGGVAHFTVGASGFPTPTYRWYRGTSLLFNSGNFSGVDTPTLTINPVALNDGANNYNCQVWDTCQCPGPCIHVGVTSNNAVLVVYTCEPAVIDDQPDSILVREGQPASFTVHATTQVLPISYQWFRGSTLLVNGGDISGADTPTLLINPTTLGDADNKYKCRFRTQCVTGEFIDIFSNLATLGVNQPCLQPVIDDQPDNLTVNENQSASFTVHATSNFTLAYLWYRGNTPMADGGNISGTQTPTLLIINATLADAGSDYRCRVDNNCTAPIFSDPASLTVTPCAQPLVTTQPISQIVNEGQPVSFTVVASGTGPLTYQWRRGLVPLVNGGNISGADTPTLTFNPVTLSDQVLAGGYRCRVSNLCGVFMSQGATLTVHPVCWADCFPDGGNGAVNIDDLVRVITSWGMCNSHVPCPADVFPNGGNGMVDIDDLVRVITAWGTCP